MNIAILDLGTNTFHILIVELLPGGGWRKVLQRRITVKLGEGGIGDNRIAIQPYKRGLQALLKFKSFIKEYDVKYHFAFGTAALRTAKNGQQFIKQAQLETGIHIELISGDEEARLIAIGVISALNIKKRTGLIMDIGGGSVEFIIYHNDDMLWKGSFKLGAALIKELVHPSDPITASELDEIDQLLNEKLKPLLLAIRQFQPQFIAGSAGSFETFASMIRHHTKKQVAHYGKNSFPINISEFNSLYLVLLRSTLEQRLLMKGLLKMRVDMIVIAAILLKFVIDHSGIKELLLSSWSLKEGIAIDKATELAHFNK